MLGMLLPGAAGGALMTVGLIGPMLGALINPATILIGLIAGGVYAWTQWSDSGRDALQGVTAFFSPLIDSAKITVGGIANAFKAGDLSLAASIAVAGIRVAFLQGMQQLVAILPTALGPLGEYLAQFAVLLSQGRWSELGGLAMAGLTTAWQTGLAGLRSLWADWTKGVVSVMSAMVRTIADLWTGAVRGISTKMLSAAASNPIMGAAMAPVLGVNMYAERQKSEAMEPQRRANMTAALTESITTARAALGGDQAARQQMEAAGFNTAGMSGEEINQKLTAAIDQWSLELAALGGPMPDFLAGARDSVDQSLAETNAKIDAALDAWTETAVQGQAGAATDWNAQAAAALEEFRAAAPQGGEGLAEALEAARADLAGLGAQAGQAAAAAAAGQEAGLGDLAAAGTGAGPKVGGTFSAWALGGQFGGGNVAQQQLNEAKRQTRIMQRQQEELAMMRAENKGFQRKYGA